jgi:ribonuclease Y
VKDTRKQAEKIKSQHKEELERVAGLTKKQAKEELLGQVKDRYEEDLLMRMRKLERSNNERLKARAKDIVISAMQRFGNSVSADIMSTTVELPAEDVKGKIIGKDGRNIRAFEKETGVELVIDDTPETVLISSFDPVRRQVARVALENLILDGRIQPARIEEMVADAREEINTIIKEKGEEAVYEAGAYDLDERIVSILGRLYFRTSYGQNVLQHSIEMAHIAGMLAEEIDADVQVAKTGALVHDIGKAVDHEISGTHVDIGMRILQKFGAPQDVIDAMKSHHEDYPYESTEAVIVQTADAISGSRPGARRENMEEYLERLADLEAIADNTAGVDRSYAIQAGREVRVFVDPEAISDLEAKKTARDIAERIEDEISYPGEVKVHIIREKRDVHYAR